MILDTQVLSQLALEWTPFYLTDDATVTMDVFKHSLSATDGLPPYSQARIIDLISNRLKKARPDPCLWVSVDAPGSWFISELDRLVKHKIPTFIAPKNEHPTRVFDFEPHGYPYRPQQPEHLQMDRVFKVEDYNLKASALRVLRILARLKTAHTREITSLSGFSETHVRNLLKQLQVENLIEWKRVGKYDGWEIKNSGLRLAHRSWNVPKGVHFAQYRGEFRYAGARHRRVSRMWRAWLETAYPSIEIWDCWTEVPVRYGIPDALAWGTHNGQETLFWLEVDSGHSSRKTMEKNYSRRLQLASSHAFYWRTPIVFCILGQPWVVENFGWCIPKMSPRVAIIGHDWREFGILPEYEFGRWNEDLNWSRHRLESKRGGELSFDPKQYPAGKKREKSVRHPKPKSTKPKFSTGSEDADSWYVERSERDE